jgi:hypothetical protein
MKPIHLIITAAIVACSTVAWFILAVAIGQRTSSSSGTLYEEVSGVWGPPLQQDHPSAWFDTPNSPEGRMTITPSSTDVHVDLTYEPKQRGLLWHRTYGAAVSAHYEFRNPTRIPQTLYIVYPLPDASAGLTGFEFQLEGDTDTTTALPSANGRITRAVNLPANGTTKLTTHYATRGTDQWRYHFPDKRRLSNFTLTMNTNFTEINFPNGTGSPVERPLKGETGPFVWNFPDILNSLDIGMDMPKQLNAGPVAARIAFFAPVSLLLFVTIVVLISSVRGIPIHPMHIFFIAAGFFAFHLLFAYLVDLIWLSVAFAAASLTSLILVSGYLFVVAGRKLLNIALPAQVIYLIAFSASFFIDGLTGITLTILGILTLGLLMFLTAKTDWRKTFSRNPPPLPTV